MVQELLCHECGQLFNILSKDKGAGKNESERQCEKFV